MSHVHAQVTAPASPATPEQLVFALGTLGQGAVPCTQCFAVGSQVHSPEHAFVSRRSQTESPGVHGRVCTQFCTVSQNSPLGQFESSGVWTHLFVDALQESSVHGTPSSQFIGFPVGMQNPPMHW